MRERGDGVGHSSRTVPSRAVIEAVACREGIDATELAPPEYEPLHDAVDPEALDSLFAPRGDGVPRGPGTVSFTYCEYRITVESDGTVDIDGDEPTDAE